LDDRKIHSSEELACSSTNVRIACPTKPEPPVTITTILDDGAPLEAALVASVVAMVKTVFFMSQSRAMSHPS
jgi:hypothetical protein